MALIKVLSRTKAASHKKCFSLSRRFFFLLQIKFLTNKPGVAMIQMSDKMASEMIIKNLNGLELFERSKLVIA